MSSPQYGERMAIGWLDVVRFADTIGYHSDTPRNIWPYRDYVIRSFNNNKPFDQFTREQLAGDLFPNPTLEERVASGFNRLLLTTEEGGAQEKITSHATSRIGSAPSARFGWVKPSGAPNATITSSIPSRPGISTRWVPSLQM